MYTLLMRQFIGIRKSILKGGENMKVTVKKLFCRRCEHKWIPRKTDVRTCPKCKSAFWNKRKEA